MVNLTTADISDSAGAQAILDAIRKRWPWVKHLFADGAYDRLKLMDKAAYLDFVIEIVRRSDDQQGFQVLPRRWVVERTFGWMTRWRRLVRDYEQRIDVSQAMILVALGGILLRRIAHHRPILKRTLSDPLRNYCYCRGRRRSGRSAAAGSSPARRRGLPTPVVGRKSSGAAAVLLEFLSLSFFPGRRSGGTSPGRSAPPSRLTVLFDYCASRGLQTLERH